MVHYQPWCDGLKEKSTSKTPISSGSSKDEVEVQETVNTEQRIKKMESLRRKGEIVTKKCKQTW